MRSRVLVTAAALAAASLWCLALIAVQEHRYGTQGSPYLAWDLTLAWAPFPLAVLLNWASRRLAPAVELVAVGAAWLVLFPNAPYLLTEFVHFDPQHPLFSAFLFGSLGVTGLGLGFASLLLVQGAVARRLGPLAGWAVACGSLFLGSVGIYLGRVTRLNSWDVVTQPERLWQLALTRLGDPLGNPQLLAFVVGLGICLTLAYVGLRAVSALAAERR